MHTRPYTLDLQQTSVHDQPTELENIYIVTERYF